MMTAPGMKGLLRVFNHTESNARLRFRCGGFPVWSAWIEPGCHISVPRLRDDDVLASAALVDPLTQVGYTVAASIDKEQVRLVAAMRCPPEGGGFHVDREPLEHAGGVGLLNLTAADVQFTLCFRDTPFRLVVPVAPQAERLLKLDQLELSVTVLGQSTAALPIRQWSSDIVIGVAEQDGLRYPVIDVSASQVQRR